MPEDEDFYLPDAMADKAIEWLHGGACAARAASRGSRTSRPGAATRRIRSPSQWADKYAGQFDQGWDSYARRRSSGRSSSASSRPTRELTPRPDAMPGLGLADETTAALYARQMEVYAGYQENADYNVGRLLDAIEEMGELDNTLVIYIWGDNGASMEGTLTGRSTS